MERHNQVLTEMNKIADDAALRGREIEEPTTEELMELMGDTEASLQLAREIAIVESGGQL